MQRQDGRRSSPAVRVLYAGAIAAGLGLAPWHARIWLGAASPGQLPWLAGALLAGALAADFLAGLVHWTCDTWGDERTPWLGPGVIRWFRDHHEDPLSIRRLDAIEVNGPAALPAGAVLGLLALPAATDALEARAPLHAFLWSLCCVAGGANHLHAWAHDPRAPRPVRRLQRAGWLLSLRHHARHHAAPHTSHYCIAIGWLNRPLDALGFWRGLESAVAAMTGARPRASRPIGDGA